MSEDTTPVTVNDVTPGTTPSTIMTDAAIKEIADDLPAVKELIAAIKSKDKARIFAALTVAGKEAKEDYDAVVKAVPEIKAGYKTTEFWLVVIVVLVNAGLIAFKGESLGFDTNMVIGALTAIYAVVRSFVKR